MIIEPLRLFQDAFLAETQTYWNCSTSGVSGGAADLDPVQAVGQKGKIQDGVASSGDESLALVVVSYPVPYTARTIGVIDPVQADGSADFAV